MSTSIDSLRSTSWLHMPKNGAGLWHGSKAGRVQTKICLDASDLFGLTGDQRGNQIIAMSGNLWITQENQQEDVVLMPGETFTISRRGMVLIQGLQPATFHLVRR